MMNLRSRAARGASAAHRGTNLVISHGLLGNGGNWSTVMSRWCAHPVLREKVRCCYALDARNHGSSPHTATHTNALMASDLELFCLRAQKEMEAELPAAGPQRAVDPRAHHGSVLVGHSMGGLATMSLLLRQFNDVALQQAGAAAAERLASGVGDGVPRIGSWEDRQDHPAAMTLTHREAGLENGVSVRDMLLPFEPRTPACPPRLGKIAAAIIVDMYPTYSFEEAMNSTTSNAFLLDCMRSIDLERVHSFTDCANALERMGVADKVTRDFLLTNLTFDSTRRRASWRSNVEVLARDNPLVKCNLSEWFCTSEQSVPQPLPCPLPVLFVFGANSPYNNREERKKIPQMFPNSTQIDVDDCGHVVHFEKMREFIDITSPFIAQHAG